MQGKCIPCLANNRAFRCEQVLNKTMFRTNQTNRIFQIYHNLNRKSKYVIFFLECTKCKVKYVGKAETEFDIRLNNHQKDVIFQAKTSPQHTCKIHTDWTVKPHRHRQRNQSGKTKTKRKLLDINTRNTKTYRP